MFVEQAIHIRNCSFEVVTFENVVGMWKRNFDKYRYQIYFGLMKLGYQFEQTSVAAQDYGDAQVRQRLFIGTC